MVMALDTPRFWREPTAIEAYTLRKGAQGLLSIISHAAAATTVPVRMDAAKLGLDAARPVHVWQLRMRDTRPAKEWEQPPAQCFDKVYLGTRATHDGKLDLAVEARPLLLELLVLSQVPLWFTEVAGEQLRTVQNNLLTASVEPEAGAPNTFRVHVEDGPAVLFLVGEDGRAPSVLLDNTPCPAHPARLGNARGFAVHVPQGRHRITVQ
jgi:hypothetical protein